MVWLKTFSFDRPNSSLTLALSSLSFLFLYFLCLSELSNPSFIIYKLIKLCNEKYWNALKAWKHWEPGLIFHKNKALNGNWRHHLVPVCLCGDGSRKEGQNREEGSGGIWFDSAGLSRSCSEGGGKVLCFTLNSFLWLYFSFCWISSSALTPTSFWPCNCRCGPSLTWTFFHLLLANRVAGQPLRFHRAALMDTL